MMTLEEIIRMARESGAVNHMGSPVLHRFTSEQLKRFAALVAEHEREMCAKVCDGWTHADGDDCAAAIRVRGTQ